MSELDIMRLALLGEWKKLAKLYIEQPYLANEVPVTLQGDTILHVCAQSGRRDVMKELIQIVPHSALRKENAEGNTVLHEVAKAGMLDIAETIIGYEEALVFKRNANGESPLYWAAMYGNKPIFLFLSRAAGHNRVVDRRNDGSTVLHAAISGKFYALALEIVDQCPYLAWSRDEKGVTPLHLLAQSPSSFKSGTIYSFQFVGALAFLSPGTVWTYACIPVAEYKTVVAIRQQWEGKHFRQKCKDYLLSGIARISSGVPLLRIIYHEKQKHTYAMQLTKVLIEGESSWSYGSDGMKPFRGTDDYSESNQVETKLIKPETTETIERPLILATKKGIIEILKEMVKIFPESVEFLEDETGKNILHLAVEHQHVYVLDWLKSMKREFSQMVVAVDRKGNSVLHVAARWRKEDKPWHIRGPAHQMQWECVQFERVKNLLPPYMINVKNYDNKTAIEVFTESHQPLVEKGEKWIKEFSNNCLLVSTLIATMMFSTAFQVPGGTNDKTGFPVLSENTDFRSFLQYVSCSLLFSVFSLGIFLSLTTSRYTQEEFFLWLPLKMTLALTALFNSVVYTVVAFCQAFILTTGYRLPPGVAVVDVFGTIVGALCSVYIYLDITLSTISYLVDAIVILIQS